jgi:hypothetical protein
VPRRRLLRQRGIRRVIAERGQEHGSGLGIFRHAAERTIEQYQQLRIFKCAE